MEGRKRLGKERRQRGPYYYKNGKEGMEREGKGFAGLMSRCFLRACEALCQ